ncbi:ADP-ribosylglycohydrolase family protein [Ornithinimicrobium panacihumi]|uniref:ADP-ribosylglycohydrolase family protein n=1 Tax=Ornithinimicrobium panacihumi TaxID=2008449 RepID=UPI003F897731
MHLTSTQTDRAAGVLLGQACGDALGVPYEFGTTTYDPATGPRMLGGGLGSYAPGEWSDDTQMAVCIARVAATGERLGLRQGLDKVAGGFIDWHLSDPADIGVQTSAVLRSALDHPRLEPGEVLRTQAWRLHERTGRTAGNGALMRTAIVGLTRLDDRDATEEAARLVAELTHHDRLAIDSCVLWSESVRRAVVDGVLDLRGGLDLVDAERQQQWSAWIDEAEAKDPDTFSRNGFTVTALQAAWSAIHHTRLDKRGEPLEGPAHVVAALHRAIAVGHDTDTVAAIAGGLLGARYGVSALPHEWTRQVHGWPGLRARDLVHLAVRTARGGHDDHQGWPTSYRGPVDSRPLGRALASDPEVILGTYADLLRTDELGVDAVVSLCRIGASELTPAGIASADHVEVWLIDSDDPDRNPHLRWALDDAARAVADLRAQGRRVLLHCVAAHHRTPSVALRYLRDHLCLVLPEAVSEIETVLGQPVDANRLWKEAQR